MRQLIIFTILFLPVVSFSQFPYYQYDTIPVGKVDTFRTRAMIVDTCFKGNVTPVIKILHDVRIRKQYQNEPGSYCVNCPNYWELVMWLDEKKKPLSRCIEIWQVK